MCCSLLSTIRTMSEIEFTTLTREQQKALFKLQQYSTKLHNLLHLATNIKKNTTLLPTNYVASSYSPFQKSDLPREQHWTWNQSNGKISMPLDSNSAVTFRKLNTRKRAGVIDAPSYKVWLFHIQSSSGPDQYFLWCEKGFDGHLNGGVGCGVTTEIGVVYPHKLSMEALSFLHPFTDAGTAKEFGWIKEEKAS